jgi:phage terminase Nu1 subunit (DNA packaging protein)
MTAPMTQSEFGALVGISQPAVSDLLAREVLTQGAPAAQWLIEYCGHLRLVASGRQASGSIDLATERALLAREQRIAKAMQNSVTRKELAPRSLLTHVLANVAPKVCGQLDSIVPALRRRSGYSAEDLDYVAQVIAKARNAMAALRLSDLDIDQQTVDVDLEEDLDDGRE